MKTTHHLARLLYVTALAAGLGTPTALAAPSRNVDTSNGPAEPIPTPTATLPIKKNPAPTSGGTVTPSPQSGPGGAVGSTPSGAQSGGPVSSGSTTAAAGPGGAVGGTANGGTAIGTRADDKGARDPANFVRPPNTVRTLYSMDEYPPTIQEQVKYNSSSASGDLLNLYTKYLSGTGWVVTDQRENNGGPSGAHQTFRHWSNNNNDSLDIYLIDLKPGLVEISINLKRTPIRDPRV